MSVAITIPNNDLNLVIGRLRMLSGGGYKSRLMAAIAQRLRSSTVERFSTKQGPSGAAWKSARNNPNTLIGAGILRSTIVGRSTQETASVGSNLIYAAIHQFGGVIKPKNASALRFQVGGRFVTTQSVTIPARPYLGVSDQDEAGIVGLVARHINGVLA